MRYPRRAHPQCQLHGADDDEGMQLLPDRVVVWQRGANYGHMVAEDSTLAATFPTQLCGSRSAITSSLVSEMRSARRVGRAQ